MEGGLYAPDKQRFVEGLVRRRENPYTAKAIITFIGLVIGIIVGAIKIIETFWWTK